MRYIVFAVLALLATGNEARAWGDLGHKIICEMAMRSAAPATRAEIRKLIKTDEEFDFFRDSCTWPDRPRKRASEHFLNLPRNASGLSSKTCPPSTPKCVVDAIGKDLEVLRTNQSSNKEKLAALKFLGHWVGDIHQPLHVSFADDRGGNEITVSGECQFNLHSTWDTCLVIKAVGSDVDAAATKLLSQITPAQEETWTHSVPADWANESFAITLRGKTKYCVRQGGSCTQVQGPVTIDQVFLDDNGPIVTEQLQKAAVRLAHLLDAALGN